MAYHPFRHLGLKVVALLCASILWLTVAVACSVALVGALRWGAARRVLSFWLLLGLAPPALYELWLVWPQLTA